MMPSSMRIALLIDADNSSPKYLHRIITEVSRFGEITIRKAYADWSKVSPKKWRDPLLIHHIAPMQEFAGKQGKNASDIALLVDVMNLAFAKEIDCACIVSSDSDFTSVINDLHNKKIKTIVIGKLREGLSLAKVCTFFIDEKLFRLKN